MALKFAVILCCYPNPLKSNLVVLAKSVQPSNAVALRCLLSPVLFSGWICLIGLRGFCLSVVVVI